jgi:hypothetical protein
VGQEKVSGVRFQVPGDSSKPSAGPALWTSGPTKTQSRRQHALLSPPTTYYLPFMVEALP